MKTVLYTVPTLRKSGPALVLRDIIKHLDRAKFSPVIVTLSDEVGTSIKSDFEMLDVPIYCLHKRGLNTFITGSFRLRRLVRQIRPDIIHANGFRDIVLTAFFIPSSYKKCASVHCDWAVEYKLKYKKLIALISSWLETKALKRIACRIAVSAQLAKMLNQKYSPMFFTFVDNGVNTERFSVVFDKLATRRKIGLPVDRKVIVWAGAFSHRKDPLTLVHAIKQLNAEQFFFVFIGLEDGLFTQCQQMLNRHNNVLFTGFVSNIEQYFQAADLYVSTSLSEGFHLTVYEAMSCGLPVILTDIDVYANLKNNPAVYFFAPKDVAALTARISELAQQDLQALGTIARQTVEQHYSAAKMAQNYMDIYKGQL